MNSEESWWCEPEKQELRNDCSRISATQRLDTGGTGMESRGHEGTYKANFGA